MIMARLVLTSLPAALVISFISSCWYPPYSHALAYSPVNSSVKQSLSHKTPDILYDNYDEEIMSIPWLIIGGGMHGVHIAARLIGEKKLTPSNLRIIDNHPYLLQSWKSRTKNTGMEYLRSSVGFHLDLDKQSLRRQFGNRKSNGVSGKKKQRKNSIKSHGSPPFARDYERPRLDIFNEHCDLVVSRYELDKIHTHGLVTAIYPNVDHVRVEVSLPTSESDNQCGQKNRHQTFIAKKVVLALGNDAPSYAEWVNPIDVQDGLIQHLLDVKANNNNSNDKDSSLCSKKRNNSIAIVGGGITAAHKALQLMHQAKRQNDSTTIHLISRHPIIEQQFDTHQEWMMDHAAAERSIKGGGFGLPSRQIQYQKTHSWKERRRIIQKERVPGTVTPAVYRGEKGLKRAVDQGLVRWHEGEVLKSIRNDDTTNEVLELQLSSGEEIQVEKVFLATGFGKKLPGGELIQKHLVEGSGLEVSDYCGFPIVDANLKWHQNIYVTGALAELELGPSARNIAGARLAAERILQSFNE